MTPRRRALLKLRLRVLFAAARAHGRVVDALGRAATLHDAFVAGMTERWREFVDTLSRDELEVVEEIRCDEVTRLRRSFAAALSKETEREPRARVQSN